MAAVTDVDALNTGGKAETTLQLGGVQWLTGLDYEYVYKDGKKKMTMVMTMDSMTTTSTRYSNIWLKAHTDNLGWYNELQGSWRNATYIFAFRLDYNQADSRDTFSLVKDDVAYYQDLASHFVNFSFGAGVKVPVARNFNVNILIGSGTRSPSLLERYIKLLPVQFDSYDYLGNPQLKPETNNQADLILEYDLRKWGQISTAGFFSYVTNYIIGEVLPPSVINPSSQGAVGVKQFTNLDHVYLAGFEFSYYTPVEKKWNLNLNIAATYGTNPKATRYLVSGGQVTGKETITHDPLPEIPPLEGSIFFSWKFFHEKLKPQVMIRLVSAQNRVSEAFTEKTTPGFYTIGASVNYYPCKYFSLLAGVDNILDEAYYDHLNRRIFGSSDNFYEPGRVFYFAAIVKF
jgi:iron complex outermembrane receptor protein